MNSGVSFDDENLFNNELDINQFRFNYYSEIIKTIDSGLILKMIYDILENKNNN